MCLWVCLWVCLWLCPGHPRAARLARQPGCFVQRGWGRGSPRARARVDPRWRGGTMAGQGLRWPGVETGYALLVIIILSSIVNVWAK